MAMHEQKMNSGTAAGRAPAAGGSAAGAPAGADSTGGIRRTRVVTLAAETAPGAPVVLGGDPARAIALAARAGYGGVELHWASPQELPHAAIADACRNEGIGVAALATGRSYVRDGLNLIDGDDRVREAAVERLFRFVDAAAPFGARVILGCIRGNLPAAALAEPVLRDAASNTSSPTVRDAALERLAEATGRVAAYAADQNVELVFEAINRYENNYLNTAAETVGFLRRFRLPNTKVLLDTFHMNIEDASFSQAIAACGDLLGYVHIADSNRLYAGGGHLPLAEIAAALDAVAYTGPLSAECLPLPDPETALRRWIEGVDRIFP